MNRARAGGFEFSLIFDFFQIEDVPAGVIIILTPEKINNSFSDDVAKIYLCIKAATA
jgi:hypothetical protein